MLFIFKVPPFGYMKSECALPSWHTGHCPPPKVSSAPPALPKNYHHLKWYMHITILASLNFQWHNALLRYGSLLF